MRPPPLRRRPRLHLRWVLLAIAAALCGALVSPHPVVAQGAPPTLPATRAAQRVVGTLDGVSATLRTTRYSHSTHIDPATGRYEWDCSAMAAWVLRRSAPEAARTVPGARPLAVDFYRTIRAAPVARPRGGWTRVARLEDARAGDVLAWPRPRWFPSRNTGHVAFVAEAPQVVSGGVLVRIVDATSLPHEGRHPRPRQRRRLRRGLPPRRHRPGHRRGPRVRLVRQRHAPRVHDRDARRGGPRLAVTGHQGERSTRLTRPEGDVGCARRWGMGETLIGAAGADQGRGALSARRR
jgi:hypothetical protein